MKQITILVLLTLHLLGYSQITYTESPITMEQLMRDLNIKGGNFTFSFDEPLFAVLKVSRTKYLFMEEHEEVFISDSAQKEHSLYFQASDLHIGQSFKPNAIKSKVMKFNLSSCKETSGTRKFHYLDKLTLPDELKKEGMMANTSPWFDEELHPNNEYLLHYYAKEGDDYEVKATLSFIRNKDDISEIRAWTMHWK